VARQPGLSKQTATLQQRKSTTSFWTMTEPCRAARYEIEEKLFNNDKTLFFPTDQLRRILDREKILAILSCRCRECVDNRNSLRGAQIDPERSVDDIRGGPHGATQYFGVFGLLIVSEFPALIFGFLRKRCNDELLEAWTTHEARFSEADLKSYTGELWRFEDRFKRFTRKFAENLPRFAVPHMQTSNFRQYHGNVVLPFIEERVIGLREGRDGLLTPEGANGTVFAFKMHPEYCRFPVSQLICFRQSEAHESRTSRPRRLLRESKSLKGSHLPILNNPTSNMFNDSSTTIS